MDIQIDEKVVKNAPRKSVQILIKQLHRNELKLIPTLIENGIGIVQQNRSENFIDF